MFFLPVYLSLGIALGTLAGAIGFMCFARKARQEQEQRVEELRRLAERAYAAAEGGAPLPAAPRRRRCVPPPSAALLAPGGDGLRAPLLQPIQEGAEDDEEEEGGSEAAPPPVQTLDELPACVRGTPLAQEWLDLLCPGIDNTQRSRAARLETPGQAARQACLATCLLAWPARRLGASPRAARSRTCRALPPLPVTQPS